MLYANLMRVMELHRVPRLVVILSTCVFPNNAKLPLRASSLHDGPPHDSNQGYAYAKRWLADASKLLTFTRVVCLSPTNLYGKYDRFTDPFRSHVVPGLVYKCLHATQGQVRVEYSSNVRRQFLYAGDFARIISHILTTEHCIWQGDAWQHYIISPPSNHEVHIGELATTIKDLIDPRLTIVHSGPGRGQATKTCDAEDTLTLYPAFCFTSLQDGLDTTIKHYLSSPEGTRT